MPPGSSFEDRRAEGLREMARSEQTAAAVALKQAGYRVTATPRGALVDGSRVRCAGGEGPPHRAT